MRILEGIFLGIVQGLTEFLPVSSSGHLVLFQRILGLNGNYILFDIILHLATLLSVIVVFRKAIWKILKNPLKGDGLLIIISAIPTFLLAFLLKDVAKDTFNGSFLGFAFLISAVLLLVSQLLYKKKIGFEMKPKNAVIMGIAQGLAIFPGISRSGATISAGLLSGVNKEEVATFSFLMSAPIILGSFVYELIFNDISGVSFYFVPTLLGFIMAFITGIFAIKIMINAVKKLNLIWFSVYLVIAAALSFIILT